MNKVTLTLERPQPTQDVKKLRAAIQPLPRPRSERAGVEDTPATPLEGL